MNKIYKIISTVSVPIPHIFTLYPEDLILCKMEINENMYTQKTFNSIYIIGFKYKISDVGFSNNPKQLREFTLKENKEYLYVEGRSQYFTIDNCIKQGYIEDVTIQYDREEKLKELL